MMRSIVIISLLAAGLASPASADDVFLQNGRVFEGVVVAALDDQRIRIRLPFGELVLPTEMVTRVVESESDLERYLQRRRELVEQGASASAWLELAQWSEAREFDHGIEDAALMAASRDPQLDGLAPLLRRLGHVLDEESGAWVPYSRIAARRPRSVAAPREVPSGPEPQGTFTEERLSRAVELLAAAQLARETRELEAQTQAESRSPQGSRQVTALVPVPTILWTGWVIPPASGPTSPAIAGPRSLDVGTRQPLEPLAAALLRRQPGSLIPLQTLAR